MNRRDWPIALVIMAAVLLSILPRCAYAAITPTLSSISSPVLVGDGFTVTGSGFTSGSVANFFVATASGPINFGPLTPTARTSTSLTFPVPAGKVTTLGQGVVSVTVVNTDQGFTQSNAMAAFLFGDNRVGFPNLTGINGNALDLATSIYAGDNVDTIVSSNGITVLEGNGFDTTHGVAIDLFCDCPGGKIPTIWLGSGDPRLTASALYLTLP